MLKTLTLAIVILAAVSCSGGGSRDDHIARGDQHVAQNKSREAILEYSLAVKADETHGPARRKLAEALIQAGDYPRGLKEMIRAADLMPEDSKVQVLAGRLLLLARQFDDARARAEKVLVSDPRNADALILKGYAMAGLRDFGGAIAQVQEAIKVDPNNSSSYANLGIIERAQGDAKQAEAAFKRAIANDPKSASARLALASLYLSTNRRAEAETELNEAVALDPTSPIPQQALVALYLASNRASDAEKPLKALAESAGPDGKLALADYYAARQRLPEARALYEQLAAGSPQEVTAKLRLATLGLIGGDRAGADRIIDAILAKEPNRVEALTAKAKLLLGDGKATEALSTAKAAVSAAPSSPTAHYVLGLVEKASGNSDAAEAAFLDAIQFSPRFAAANAELAKLAIAAGQSGKASGYAQAAVDAAPAYAEAYLLLARAKTAEGKTADADRAIGIMVANFPDSPAVQAELGRLLLAKGDSTRAAAAFDKALAKDPLQPAALEGMVAVEVNQKQNASARKRLDAAVAAAPKNGEILVMAARMYFTAFKDATAAEDAIKRALEANPNNLEAFNVLARLYVERNNLPVATAEFEKLAQKQPKSVATQTAVGVLNHLQGKTDAAKAAYERVLSLDPRAVVASNNLAELYSSKNENLDQALQLAQTAKAGAPGAHEIDDTLGWIYYKKGVAELSIVSLKAAVAAQPENAVYLYHLGAAYALRKDNTNARQALEKALKLQPQFPGADDARKMLSSLR